MKNIRYNVGLFFVVAVIFFACGNVAFSQQDGQLYVKVKRVEGQGNGGNWLNLTATSRDSIMAGAPWKVQQPEYEYGTSPVLVRVIDPTALQTYDYTLKIDPVADSLDSSLVDASAHWTLTWYQNSTPIGSYVSQHTIGEGKEEVIAGHGIAITVKNHPFMAYDTSLNNYIGGNYTYANNARYTQPDLIGSEVDYETSVHWLGGLQDVDVHAPGNWIRAGHNYDHHDVEIYSMIEAWIPYRRWRKDDFFNTYKTNGWDLLRGFMDYHGQFENMAEGRWTPYVLSSPYDGGPMARFLNKDLSFAGDFGPYSYYDSRYVNSISTSGHNQTLANLYSVDIVLTPDTSLWTRALVLEAGSSENVSTFEVTQHFRGQTYQNIRHEPKTCPSVDKNGNPDNSGTTGFGWFPGYAINVETGERLNIMFAENSEDEYNHGNDMLFNPTNVFAFQKDSTGNCLLDNSGNPIPMSVDEYDSLYESFYDSNPMGEPLYGGRHYVYICGSSGNTINTFYTNGNVQRSFNNNGKTIKVVGNVHGGTFMGSDSTEYPWFECGAYDEGKWLEEKFKKVTEVTNHRNMLRKQLKMQVFNNVMWTGIPMPAEGMEDYWLDNTVTVKLRVTRPYMFYSSAVGAGPEVPLNENAPMFAFTTQDYNFAQDFALYDLHDNSLTDNHIDVNNVDATVSPCSGGWFKDPTTGEPFFKYPKGQLKSTTYAYSFWMGGLDGQDSLHLFAETFHDNGYDTWPGPLSKNDASTDAQTVAQWNRTFKITRQEVLEFLAGYQDPDYTIPQHILDWPAHGDTIKGQAWLLAPFTDVDGDGVYNPKHGDHPDFPGDMAQFVIFNDSYGEHSESGGEPFGVETHVLVYAYNTPEDTVMNNTIFFNYKVFNRSQTDYHDTYIGLWCDWDLGYGYDDYLGCDVAKNAVYCYNGYEKDGERADVGASWTYDRNWPVQSLKILAGPTIPADNLDNPAYADGADCAQYVGNGWNEYALNGSGFGDGVPDNERYGLTGFIYNNNRTASNGNPNSSGDYYNLMRSLWYDGMHLKYGADGCPSDGSNSIDCRFAYPGNSDLCYFGTYGVELPDSLQYAGLEWTEVTAGNSPYDRRGIASMGPFNLPAGGMQEFSFCMVILPHHYAVDSNGISMDSLYRVNPDYRSPQFVMPVVYNLYETICEGDEYNFFGDACDQSGMYSHISRNTLNSNEIADTVYQLHLTVIPRITLIQAGVLPGAGYHENGFNISSQETEIPGTYVHTLYESSGGCDHVTMLFLDVQTVAPPSRPFKVYPNPTTQFVTVEMEEMDPDVKVMVFDMQGNTLLIRQGFSTEIRINMADYPAGIYLIKVGDYVAKIVKK